MTLTHWQHGQCLDNTTSTMEVCTQLLHEIINHTLQALQEEEDLQEKQNHDVRCLHYTTHSRTQLQPLLTKEQILSVHPVYNNIYQVAVLTQRDPVSCGYHTFHNAYTTLKGELGVAVVEANYHSATLATNRGHEEHFLRQLRDPAVYQHRKQRMIKALAARVAVSDGCYPWTEKDLAAGVMERPYMKHLVETFPLSLELGGPSSFISVPDCCKVSCTVDHLICCQNSLKNFIMSTDHMHELQTVFDRFQQRSHYSHAFLIGMTNHWAAVVANKVNDHVELLLLDSRCGLINYAHWTGIKLF